MEKPWEVVEFSASRIFGASLPDADDLNQIEIGKLSLIIEVLKQSSKSDELLMQHDFFSDP